MEFDTRISPNIWFGPGNESYNDIPQLFPIVNFRPFERERESVEFS